MGQDAPSDSAGPSSPPPPLPEGWLAQWEGVSRRWYYVQRTSGVTQWEVPTQPIILTPSTTPTSTGTGPSRGPPSAANSPPVERWQSMTPAEGSYNAGAERGGFSSWLASSSGNVQQGGGLSQMGTGMMGRFSSQAAQNRPAGQHPFHENRFGYSSDGQAGVYTGVAPPYHSSGQSTPGVNTMNNASGAPQESVISASQGFAAKLSGNEPGSPFMPTLFQGQQQPQAVQSTTPSNLPPSSQAETDASESMPGVTGSTSPSQPEWRVGPKPHVPIETKPATTLSTAGYTMGTGAGIQSQQQQQQRPTTQGYSSQVPFQGLQSQPPLPQPWGVDAASSAQTHSPGPHHGTPDAGTQDLPSALPSSQQGFNVQHTMMKPGGVQEQSPVNTYVQGSYSQPSPPPSSQGMYATHPQYQAFSPSQLKSEGVYTGSNPLPATTTTATTGSYGIPSSIHPSHASLASQAWGISQQIGGAFSHNSGSMGGYANNSGTYPQMANSQMDAFTGNNTHPGALQHYQPYHPGPHSGGPALGNYNQWGQSTAPAPPRAAMSDPQFVSGPWASVTPPGGGGMRPPPHYSGAYGYGGR